MKAFLHFGTGNEPRETVTVEARESLLPWQARGMQQTASGYGLKLTTPYMVKWEGRWRRVYVRQYSNAGTAYLGKPGAWLCTVDIDR